MNNTTVYVGMDVHKNSFSLCCYTVRDDACSHYVKIDPDYRLVFEYIESMRGIYGDDSKFICGYEAGYLDYTLYHQINDHGVECIILVPSTMAKSPVQKKKKTDRRDSEVIARCLAHHSYHKVHVPTSEEEQIKEFICMRDDHKLALKKIKQQIPRSASAMALFTMLVPAIGRLLISAGYGALNQRDSIKRSLVSTF